MNKTIEMLKNFVPCNEQEETDLKQFIEADKIWDDILTRNNTFCHLTASAFITNKERTKVLCIYHNLYKSWGWVGGHADGDDDPLYVAKKETREETSLENFKVIDNKPISIEAIQVSGHVKKGKYVSPHIHLNITYLFEADEKDKIHILEDENSNIGWLTFQELLDNCEEAHMLPIYRKIIDKITK